LVKSTSPKKIDGSANPSSLSHSVTRCCPGGRVTSKRIPYRAAADALRASAQTEYVHALVGPVRAARGRPLRGRPDVSWYSNVIRCSSSERVHGIESVRREARRCRPSRR
jgi:hypothetical protein